MIARPPFPKCWDSNCAPFMRLVQKGNVTSAIKLWLQSLQEREGRETPTQGHTENRNLATRNRTEELAVRTHLTVLTGDGITAEPNPPPEKAFSTGIINRFYLVGEKFQMGEKNKRQ